MVIKSTIFIGKMENKTKPKPGKRKRKWKDEKTWKNKFTKLKLRKRNLSVKQYKRKTNYESKILTLQQDLKFYKVNMSSRIVQL